MTSSNGRSLVTRLATAAIVVLCGLGARTASGQGTPPAARTAPLTVRGRITGPDSQPLPRAVVSLAVAGAPLDSATTDAGGTFSFRMSRDGALLLKIRALGFQPIQRPVERPLSGDVVVMDVRMQRSAVTLSAVKVQESRIRKPTISDGPPNDVGGSGQYLGGTPSPADVGNLAAMASAIPGVTLTQSADGGMPGFSVLGLSASQNNVTLNGLSFGGAQIPSAAMAMTRLQTTSFDPSVGGFSGGLLSTQLYRGSNWKNGILALTVDDPALQWTDAAGSRLGQRYQNLQLSVSRLGPIVHDKLFYNVAVQGGRRANDLTTLANADPSALAAVGVSEAASAELYDALEALGVPAPRSNVAQTSTKSGSLLARFDILPTQARSLNVTFNGGWSETGPSLLGPTALPTHGGSTNTLSGGAQIEHQHYVKDRFLSRTRSGVSLSRSRSTALAMLPDGQVLVGSQLADGRAGLATLQFGGASGAGRDNQSWFWETTHEDSWYIGKKHLLKVAGGLRFDDYTNDPRSNQFGTFAFNSLDDLRAERPTSFTRSLGGWETHGTAGSGWASIGDQLRLTDRLTFQYGLRGEANRYGVVPGYNSAIDSLFGVRTDAAPQTYAVSPRLGFSWGYGKQKTKIGSWSRGAPRGTIRGGIGLFRGSLAPTLLAQAINGTGLPGALQRITCVGPAVPTPDWEAYVASSGNIPTACADGVTAFADARSPVTLFLPGYDAPQSWRGTLGWSAQPFGRFYVTAEANVTRSLDQPSARDLNFGGVPRFALGDEDGRTVFTAASSIDPASGAVDPLASRATSRYSRVAGLTSDLHSRSEQLTLRLSPSGGVFVSRYWGLTYSIARVRDQTRGFDGAAFGDPRTVAWGPSVGDVRHTIGANVSWSISRFGGFNLSTQFRSGAPFTPVVTGDVNGDGNAANDRAFIVDPAKVGDPDLARDMRALLASAPDAVRECLTKQLGHAAARNSCRGPWTATMNASVNIRGDAVRMPYGSSLRLNLSNPLAGIDQLLHDDTRLRGWGQFAPPNGALLVVKGFDPSTQQFRYAVNPAFGDVRPARSAVRVPFQITLGASLPITPPWTHQLLEQVVEPGRKWKGQKLTAQQIKQRYVNDGFYNPLTAILAAKDSLLLTKSQLAALDSIGKQYNASLDSAWTRLADDITKLPEHYDRSVLLPRVREAKVKAWDALSVAATRLDTLLLAEQKERLAPEIAQLLDAKTIEVLRASDMRGY